MTIRPHRLLRLSSLAAGLLLAHGILAAGAAGAADAGAPTYSALPAAGLCPAAADDKAYNTKYLGFFTHLVPAQEDWLFRTTYDLRTDFGTTPEGWRELKALREALERRGVELMVVYQPTRGLINREKLSPEEKASFDYELAKKNYLATIAKFREAGIYTPDFSPLFDEKEAHPYYFKGDHHWTPYGAMRSAKIAAETLKQMPAYADIPKKEFESKRVGLLSKLGTFHKAAAQLCGSSYAPQYVDRFETEPVGDSGGGDLFDDGGDPQVAVVGTSNSGPAYNFVGFLEQYGKVDILNNAVSGGGFDSSLLAYLTSKEFHDKPPKILVWEFATHYDMAQKSFYRQAMPLVANGCAEQKAVLSRKVKLHAGRNEVLLNSAALPIRSGSYTADVTYSDPGIHELKNTVWYMNGRREQLKIEQSKAVDTGGRYVFELRNDEDWPDQQFLSLEIEAPDDMPAGLEVEAKLCQTPQIKATASTVAGR
ncbi:alginate O-acetyltransferase [Pseudomonas sp. NBRC 100443]|uniref:alginate O-acetyltransferase n=1 Tax=Pseudomonas sp. NBRC 100443 TaxID=1113665 RepID=UPI0024A16D8E|nr:alginate O-acetyltransferase [Pseudomonas sp. NBRC 100443]GLU40916.1 alginate biosynthesis protein AlgX [Pseudomonas sp. NBRC 100443]